jgi:hypothetical protein
MPCPLPLAPRKTHRTKAKQPVPSFSRIAPALGRGFIPSEEGSPQFPTTCAASSAQHALRAQARLQPKQRELQFSSLPLALIHPRKTPRREAQRRASPLKRGATISGRAATAARNCTSYPQRPAAAFAFDSATSGREFIPSPKRSDAVPYALRRFIRATRFARKRAVQPNQRELHFSSLPLAPIHPRNTSSLRAATAARNCSSCRQPPAGAFRPSIFSRARHAVPAPASSSQNASTENQTTASFLFFASHERE